MPRLTNAQKQENYRKRKKEAEEGSQRPKKSSKNENYTRCPSCSPAGDFNLDTCPGKNNDWFIEFMEEELGLEIRNDPAQSTTLGGSAIDHIFTRRLSHLKSVNYATYFSHHKPRLTITET